jgi:hypothetical protein
LLPGPQTTWSGQVARPRRAQYPATADSSAGCPATGPYPLAPVAAASARRSAGCTGSPASPNASGSTGCPRARRAATASFAARVAETGTPRTGGGRPACHVAAAARPGGQGMPRGCPRDHRPGAGRRPPASASARRASAVTV